MLQLVFPYLTSHLVDVSWGRETVGDGGVVGMMDGLDNIALFLIVTVVLILVCVYFETTLFGEVGERLVAQVRQRVFGRLVLMPMEFFARNRVGELTARVLGDLSLLQEFWITDCRLALRYSALVLGGVVLMFTTSVPLASAVFALLPVAVLVGWFFGRKIRGVSMRTQDLLAESSVVLEEVLHGIQGVKTFGNETYEEERYRGSVISAMRHGVAGARARAVFLGLILLVMFGAWVFVMWFGSGKVMSGQLSPGEFTGFMFYLFFVGSSVGTLAETFSKFQRVVGANTRITALMDEGTEVLGETGDVVVRGEVSFENVSFAYPVRADVPVLSDVSFQVSPGERIALVGPSGAGKSTVVSLLLRLFEPGSGSITVDGRPAQDYSLRALRGQMAMVSQEVILFGGSVEENIAYGKPGAPFDKIREVAGRARVLDFVESLPEGFDTRLGDRGMRLSGGQRQRIAIARAMLRDPAILILDEATSALDAENERLVQEALESLMEGRTTFVIAHRLRTVRKADRILVIKSGSVVESGTHGELFAQGGLYRLLCEGELGESGMGGSQGNAV